VSTGFNFVTTVLTTFVTTFVTSSVTSSVTSLIVNPTRHHDGQARHALPGCGAQVSTGFRFVTSLVTSCIKSFLSRLST
jgi:hypothetical protein